MTAARTLSREAEAEGAGAESAFRGLDDVDVRRLGEGEVLVCDGALGREPALVLARALCADADELTPAAIGRGDGLLVEPVLRGDLTTWLERGADARLAPLWALFDRVAGELRERAFLGVLDVEVQLALYPGDGARYVAHRDAFESGGRRRATAVYYLNPEWCAEHGGALRVHLAGGGTRDIEPVLDRLVVYLAHLVEHEVLPTTVPRWAVTAWMLGPLSVV
jgi:SM-20-related protein